MTELFTDYKNAVDEALSIGGFLVPASEEYQLLQIKRMAHRNGVGPLRCAQCIVTLMGKEDPNATVTLTEAGAAALAQRDKLTELEPVDPSEDDEVRSDPVMRALERAQYDDEPAELTPVNHGAPEAKRKVPRK